ncbi:MAG: hypothetical protein H6656_00675 [Ardenticatenaceae bacterium]|nr:hypothetical protein [Anaerolineales bacterium]MCB9005898.1 hypothetical protein [Ardenticatenaceae bacterium]
MPQQSFSTLLNSFLVQDVSSLGRVSLLTGISTRTLENWASGAVKRPRRWRDIVNVCQALSLNKQDATALLDSAGHKSIDELYSQVLAGFNHDDIQLFAIWGAQLQKQVPVAKPPKVPFFTGRSQIVEQIVKALVPGQAIAICGPGGIGKTSLAAEIAWNLAPDSRPPTLFPDGLFYHSFYKQNQVEIALEEIARTFGENPTEGSAYLAAKRALVGSSALLVLDGTEVADNLDRLLTICGSCGILITSRRREDARSIRIDLETLSPEDSLTLLKQWGRSRVDNEAAARRICDLVDGLPLAITLVGKYLSEREENASEYLEWLETTPLKALNTGERQHESIPILLKKSLTQIHPQVNEIFSLLGFLAPKPFDRNLIATASQLPYWDSFTILGELVNYGLLQRPSQEYVISHALIHSYASDNLPASGKALAKLVSWFKPKLAVKQQDSLKLTVDERAHLLNLFGHCQKNALQSEILAVAQPFETMLDVQGHWAERLLVIEEGLAAAQAANDPEAIGIWFARKGAMLSDLGDATAAIDYFSQAINHFQNGKNILEEAKALERLSLNYSRLSDFTLAESLSKQALQIAQNHGDQQAEAQYQNTLARIYRLNDEYERAFHHANLSIDLARSMNDRYQEQISLGNLGRTFIDASDFEAASSNLEEALSIAREVGSKRHELDHLKSLGLSYFFLGRWEEDLECQRKAHEIIKELNYRQMEAFVYSNFAHVEIQLGQAEKAFQSYQNSIDLFQKMGNLSAELTQRLNQLECFVILGRADEAFLIVNTILKEAQSREFTSIVSQSLAKRGTILRYLNRPDLAISSHTDSLSIAKDYGSNWDIAALNTELGTDYLVLGDIGKSIFHFQTSLSLLNKMNGLPWQVMLLAYLSIAFLAQDNHVSAEETSKELVELAHKTQLVAHGRRLLQQRVDLFKQLRQPKMVSICYEVMSWLSEVSV